MYDCVIVYALFTGLTCVFNMGSIVGTVSMYFVIILMSCCSCGVYPPSLAGRPSLAQ